MATTGDSPVFIDTNVLVFANLESSPFHERAVTSLTRLAQIGAKLFTSRQVLREYLAAISRPGLLADDIPVQSLIQDVKDFENGFIIIEDSPAVTAKLMWLVEKFAVRGKQIHDANIVATMLAYEVPSLLTHNIADFTRYSDMINLIPLEVKT